MTSGPGPLRDERRAALARALSVTRVARVTGLDRTGVEVASAIRPAGHVLQVSNGKGGSFEEAATGALLEAAELWGAERPRVAALASAVALRARGADAIGPEALGAAAGADEVRLAWAAAEDLSSGRPVLVPAQAVFCPPADVAPLGPALLPWTSNGMGAHPDRDAALLHAVLEAVERDQLARALPEGFTDRELRRRLVDPEGLARAAPHTAVRARDLEARGLRVHLLDLAPERGGLGLPCAAALLVEEGGTVPVAAGYACRLDRDGALLAALLEAAQSRATEIHGAREDVVPAEQREAAGALAGACARTRPTRPSSSIPQLRRSAGARAGVAAVLGRLRRAGLAAAAASLPAPEGVHVVKAIVPGLLLSELL